MRVKISIFIWTKWKNSICIDFVHKSHLEPFSVQRACTKSYVTSEPYPRASQMWCQTVRETLKKIVVKCRGESFARCRVIARNVEGGHHGRPPPSLIRFKAAMFFYLSWTFNIFEIRGFVAPATTCPLIIGLRLPPRFGLTLTLAFYFSQLIDYIDNLRHCLFLLTRLIFHVFELLFQYVLSILYVIAKYFSLRATTLQSFTINHKPHWNDTVHTKLIGICIFSVSPIFFQCYL